MSRISKSAMHWKLPPWFSRFFTPGAPDAHAALSYDTKLLAAHVRSLYWGLRPPVVDHTSVRYAPAAGSMVFGKIHQALGHLSDDLVTTQRFGLVLLIRDLLEREFRIRLIYTLGYVYQDGQRLYYTPIEGLEQMLKTGIKPGVRISLHAWLTLPSHEVIDATFWAAFPAYACAEERNQRGLFMHPDQMPGRSYHPQWVGEGFLRKIEVLKEYEGW